MFPVTPFQVDTLLTQETTTLQARMQALQGEEATGTVYQTPAQDPLAAVSVMQWDASLNQAQIDLGHLTQAQTALQAVAGALQVMTATLDTASQLAVQGQNATLSAADRAALAEQAQGLIQQFTAQLNLQVEGLYVFAAWDPSQPVASGATVTNVPPPGQAPWAQELPTSPVTTLAVTLNGFEPGIWPGGSAASVFQLALNALSSLAAALPTGAMQGVEGQLASAATWITEEQTLVGARLQQAQAQQAQTETWQTTLQQAQGTTAGADVAQVTAALTQATQAYQAALQTGAALLQTENLLAFLHP